jgi:alpha-tubulin suppressor-like RCC1 family protein
MRMRFLVVAGTAVASLALVEVACSGSDSSSGPENDADAPDGQSPDAPKGDAVGASDADGTSDGLAPTDSGLADSAPICTATPCVVGLGAGGYHTCALIQDGTVRCWGRNMFGEVGVPIASSGSTDILQPVVVPNVAGGVEVAAGGIYGDYGFSCARLGNGSLSCWGSNRFQKLGRVDAGTNAALPPGPVVGVGGATSLSVGAEHVCTTVAGGAVTCWGSNAYGERGVVSAPPEPSVVSGLPPASQTRAGVYATCVLSSDGTVSCFGDNAGGALGVGADAGAKVSTPLPVAGLSGVTALASGQWFQCALLGGTGKVVCWGNNASGQLGRTTSGAVDPVPGEVVLPHKAVAIGSGVASACAALDDQSLWCWGYNGKGEVGVDPADAGSAITHPVQVSGLPPARILALRGGAYHMCALLEGGTVHCWGANFAGELGRGTASDVAAHPAPQAVAF